MIDTEYIADRVEQACEDFLELHAGAEIHLCEFYTPRDTVYIYARDDKGPWFTCAGPVYSNHARRLEQVEPKHQTWFLQNAPVN